MKERFRKMMDANSELENMKRERKERQEHSEKNANAYTVFLCIVSLAIAVLFFVYKDLWFGLGFVGLSVLLGVVAFFSYRSERKQAEKNNDIKSQTPAENKEE